MNVCVCYVCIWDVEYDVSVCVCGCVYAMRVCYVCVLCVHMACGV